MPLFCEWFTNVMASDDNPTRHGMYVETKVVTGRMNRGTWWRLTDGQGRFWESNPKNLVPGLHVPSELRVERLREAHLSTQTEGKLNA